MMNMFSCSKSKGKRLSVSNSGELPGLMTKKKLMNKKNIIMRGGNKEFNLYTTGITDWGNINPEDSILKIWNDILLPKMINILLEAKFTKINVYHHDIMEDQEHLPFPVNKNYLQRNVNQRLNEKDREFNGNDSFIKSIFTRGPIDFEHISYPHLIFDFAHLFSYMYLPGHNKSIPFIRETYEIIPNINVLYLGYLGERIQLNRRSNNGRSIPLIELITSDFVRIDESGVVFTYIDKISEHTSLTQQIITNSRQNLSNNSGNITMSYPSYIILKIYSIQMRNSRNQLSFQQFMKNYLL